MVYVAAPLALREGDRERLESLARPSAAPGALARRARIILLAADGVPNTEIAARVGVTRPTVISWRNRYTEAGIAGLRDHLRSGRPPGSDEIGIVVATLSNGGRPPAELGAPRWSSRLLADRQGTSPSTVARVWRRWEIEPHRTNAFAFPTDPPLAADIREIVGLHLDPRGSALIVLLDETSQVTTPLPYAPQDFTALRTALEIHTGAPGPATSPADQALLAFLKLAARTYPDVTLHVLVDNPAACSHPRVSAWLAANPQITPHITSADRSWLNLAEILLGISRQAVPGSAKLLHQAIRTFLDADDDGCEPFTWTKPPDGPTIKRLAARHYRGLAGHQRTAARRERLIEAGLDLFGTVGYTHTTVEDICKRSELARRYFYESFTDRQALMKAVYDTEIKQLTHAVLAAVAEVGPEIEEMIKAGLTALIHHLAADRHRVRLIFLEIIRAGPATEELWLGARHQFTDLVIDIVTQTLNVPRSLRLAIGAKALTGAVNELMTDWALGELNATVDEITTNCIDLFTLLYEQFRRDLAEGHA